MATSFRKRKKTEFNPSHEDLERAMSEFLQHGGEIKKLNQAGENRVNALSDKNDSLFSADDFLMGR